jgi:hypothetical protein
MQPCGEVAANNKRVKKDVIEMKAGILLGCFIPLHVR